MTATMIIANLDGLTRKNSQAAGERMKAKG
jgi:hypothetical protein